MRAPLDASFSRVPEVAFEQAIAHTKAFYPTPEGEQWLLIWARYARIEALPGTPCDNRGQTLGIELVAYPCTKEGFVLDFEKRYQVEGTSVEMVMDKLRYGMANGLLDLHNFEGFLEQVEAMRARCFGVDWEQMPHNLQ